MTLDISIAFALIPTKDIFRLAITEMEAIIVSVFAYSETRIAKSTVRFRC